ncbi:MAG: dynamin family protein, partial [Oscillospiraceae bacterium]|nr:dynamin family protein [Oscillospiraceae bacterium]
MSDLIEMAAPSAAETDLQFVKRVLAAYPWDDAVKTQLEDSFSRLNAKYSDKKLNISVVGEFSTGKSTFINALLRTELLAAASLQGTTVSSTILEFGKQCSVAIIRKDGQRQIMRLKSVDETKKALRHIVSYNDDAQSIETVAVTLPVPALQNTGLRIVDTPGTDATELWHEDVTVRAIEELSDLSIVLVNGTKPLPESFCDFIEENLGSVLERCVFVVTKLDLIPPKERSQMLQYIGMKLQNTLGLENPVVLPFYSAEIIGTFAENEFARGDKEMIALSQRTEKVIRSHSAVWRKRIQTQRKEILFEQIYGALGNHMAQLSEDMHQRLELLEKSRSVDLEAFMKAQKLEMVNGLYTDSKDVCDEMRQQLREHKERFIESMVNRVNQYPRVDLLQQFVRVELAQSCYQASRYQDKLAMTYYGRVGNLRDEKMRQFRDAFQQLYADLNVLSVKLPYTPRCLPAAVPVPAIGNSLALAPNLPLMYLKNTVVQQM